MRRVDHQPERRIDNRARLLRVEVLHQLGRALDVREQRRHRLALPLDCRRNVRLFWRDANIGSRRCGLGCTGSGRCRVTRERRAALLTELGCGLIIRGAFWTAAGQRAATFGAKPLACGALGSALGATHAPYPRCSDGRPLVSSSGARRPADRGKAIARCDAVNRAETTFACRPDRDLRSLTRASNPPALCGCPKSDQSESDQSPTGGGSVGPALFSGSDSAKGADYPIQIRSRRTQQWKRAAEHGDLASSRESPRSPSC